MYADPARIRKHVIKIYVNDYEKNVLTSVTELNGEQLGPNTRELALLGAQLRFEANSKSKENK